MPGYRTCRVLSLLVLFSTSPVGALAQKAVDSSHFRVQVRVSAEVELRSLVQKSLEAELRALPGVLATDSSPDYIISVIALKVATQSRKDVGTTFSVLVTEPYSDRIRRFAELHLTPELGEQLVGSVSSAVRPVTHWVETAPAGDVLKVCRSIVKSFEQDALSAAKVRGNGLN